MADNRESSRAPLWAAVRFMMSSSFSPEQNVTHFMDNIFNNMLT